VTDQRTVNVNAKTQKQPEHLLVFGSVLDAIFRLATAAAAARTKLTTYLRLTSIAVPRVRRSRRHERAVSTNRLVGVHPHDGVPTTTTRVRSLGTPIVHSVGFRCVTETGANLRAPTRFDAGNATTGRTAGKPTATTERTAGKPTATVSAAAATAAVAAVTPLTHLPHATGIPSRRRVNTRNIEFSNGGASAAAAVAAATAT